jgi:hypothetical protein
MQSEDHSSQFELVVKCEGASLEEARARAREKYGPRTVVREVIVEAGGQFTLMLTAENEPLLREREQHALPTGAVVKDRRVVLPREELLQEEASSEDELLEKLRLAQPQHRILSVICRRQPATGVFGLGKHLGEYEVTSIDTLLRSKVTYTLRASVEVVVVATPGDCLEILHEPVSSGAAAATSEYTRKLAAARWLAEQADPSHGDAILDTLERFRRDENAARYGGRDIYPVLARALERIATPPLIPDLLARWAPAVAEWQSWAEDNHLRVVAALIARLARSAPGFEALAGCLLSPEVRVRTSARALVQSIQDVPVPPGARRHMQEYEKRRAHEVRAWLDENHPGIVHDRFCLDLLGRLAERQMRVAADRDELADWAGGHGLSPSEGEALVNVLVSAGLAAGPWQDGADPSARAFYGITDNGRSVLGASLFGR